MRVYSVWLCPSRVAWATIFCSRATASCLPQEVDLKLFVTLIDIDSPCHLTNSLLFAPRSAGCERKARRRNSINTKTACVRAIQTDALFMCLPQSASDFVTYLCAFSLG